jgi:hypothetical protein
MRAKAEQVCWSLQQTDGWQRILVGKQHLDLSKTWWPNSIQFMLNRGEPDIVLVAPKRDLSIGNSSMA